MPARKFGGLPAKTLQQLKVVNKGSKQAMLPNRRALTQLTRGTPDQQSLGNYAKLTPSGGAGQSYNDIQQEGQQGPAVVPALSPDQTDGQ